MSHFVLQEFCWFSEKDALETDVFPSTVTTTAVKARHVTCGENLLMDHRYKLHLSIIQTENNS